ncbi:hypothetical protein HPB50_025602 [Hyalomma asiaticum]|uniref:Uncharacterized protein n=1 Tax=Hyalomma asiaticum TaxID=266040 RepID=A0ACB7TA11_HYAAI|nr:hypothetical protein HPB50_025602 [Hyalomma asiaticum]
MNSLHFKNNDLEHSLAGKDMLFKIRPVIDNLIPKFQMLVVDEQIAPFKGRSSLKQYVPSKPHKWGYKISVLCDVPGPVYDFSIYRGTSALFLDYLTLEQALMLCWSFRAPSQVTRTARRKKDAKFGSLPL